MAYVTPGTVAAGDVYTAASHNIIVNDVIDGRSYQNRYARFKRSAGSLTLNTVVFANLPTIAATGDLTINASTGDVVEIALCASFGNEAEEGFLDAVTVVGGVVTNSFALDSAPSNTAGGILSWRGTTGRFDFIGGSFFRTLAAGDISAGTVTVRIRCKTGSASNKTLFATTDNPLEYWLRNHGPVTT